MPAALFPGVLGRRTSATGHGPLPSRGDGRLSAPEAGRPPHSPCYLVAELLAGNNGDLLAHALVGVEVVAQARVVLLDDDPGRLLHGLGANAALRAGKTGSPRARTGLRGTVRRHAPGSAGWGRARGKRAGGLQWSAGVNAQASCPRRPRPKRARCPSLTDEDCEKRRMERDCGKRQL